ncbi:MAG: ATP-binding protein [bacterium]
MKKEIIKEIIRDFQIRELPTVNKRIVTLPLDAGKIITITGVRRCGKTYLMYDAVKRLLEKGMNKENIVYINFEDERLEFKTEELDIILQAYREMYPDTLIKDVYFFFDEVQNVVGWEKFIRRIAESLSNNIFITGSNARLLSSEIATALRGRSINYEIFPLTFREYLDFLKADTDLYNPTAKAKIIRHFKNFLLNGGFPEILHLKKEIGDKILQEYFNVMIYRDIVERFNLTNLPALKYFMKRVFESVTNPLSVNKIYNELKSRGYKIGKNMLYEFLEAAEAVYLALPLKKYSSSILKEELSEKKIYCIDNGLLNSISYNFKNGFGKLLENLVFLELKKTGKNIRFIKNGRECDFIIIEKDEKKQLIQISYTLSDRDTKKREVTSLTLICKSLGINMGTILTYDEEMEIIENDVKIQVLPVYRFLFQLQVSF